MVLHGATPELIQNLQIIEKVKLKINPVWKGGNDDRSRLFFCIVA
jgi:hypothetical protein